MSEPLTLTGIVLSAAASAEYDKRLIILTRERGKITAFAHGARKTGSALMAACNPFVFGQFTVYEGRTAYTLTQVSVIQYFTELASEFPGVYYGFYFLDIAEYYGREGKAEKDMLNLLYLACKALSNPHLDDRLVRRIFELRALVINGSTRMYFPVSTVAVRRNLSCTMPERAVCSARTVPGRWDCQKKVVVYASVRPVSIHCNILYPSRLQSFLPLL